MQKNGELRLRTGSSGRKHSRAVALESETHAAASFAQQQRRHLPDL